MEKEDIQEKVDQVNEEQEEAKSSVIDEDLKIDGLDYRDWKGIDEMESLCMVCGGTGKTRFMLHKIPYFREMILASFICDNCGERNNEVTFGGEIQVQGCKYVVKMTQKSDLDRQIIKSDSASVKIVEIDLEIPPATQKGEITTIEGILRTAAKNLSYSQPQRMQETPEVGIAVAQVIARLYMMADGDAFPFNLILDDPAGNSFIQNPHAPHLDPNMSCQYYPRSPDQDRALGLDPEKGLFKDDKDGNLHSLMLGKAVFGGIKEEPTQPKEEEEVNQPLHMGLDVRLGRTEAVSIPSTCPNCHKDGDCMTALTDIPHFKEVIIMAFDCHYCGFRTNEVKAGGAVPTYGSEVRLKVCSEQDLKRDLLKSDSAGISIPELDLDLQVGSLGGMFTTIEGIMNKIYNNLCDQNPFVLGDSTTLHHSNDQEISDSKLKFKAFIDLLLEYASGKHFPFTFIVRDPLGNSFISAPLGSFLPPEMDPNLELIDFERTYEENEEFGLNDINTKDFETGVNEDYEQGPILPDRLTHKWERGADHPTPYAKGTYENDTTENGLDLKVAGNLSTVTEETPVKDEYFEAPAGWSFEKVNENVINPVVPMSQVNTDPENQPSSIINPNKRIFNDDSALDYIPREEFYGSRPGYCFRLGSKGLGYYEDKPMVAVPEESTA